MNKEARNQAFKDMKEDNNTSISYIYFAKEILELTREEASDSKKPDFRFWWKKEEFKIYK